MLPRIPPLLQVPVSSQHLGALSFVMVHGIPCKPICCSYPPSSAFLAGAGGKGQAVKAKLLLEALKMQTNTSDTLRSLLGEGRAKKK